MKTFLRIFILLFGIASFAQTNVTGTVNDESGMPLSGANVIVMGTSSGAISDFDGKFTLSVSQAPPFTLQISSVGFTTATEEVTANNQDLSITLIEGSFLDEVIVSATRTPQRIFESPVTVEKYSLKQIQRTPSADFFEGLQNVKGVQMNQSGLVFSQVNTRGFGTIYNEGFVTLIDGMNSQAPVFGFAVGNLIGLNELDVQSVELLPGSASALYGMDAYKGVMSIKSKNPFDHEGINGYFRSGTTQQDAGGNNAFTDFGFRFAKKLSDKWAVKAAFSAKKGKEWAAADTRHQRACDNCGEGSIVEDYPTNAPDYNAVNEYGEVAVSSPLIFGSLATSLAAGGSPAAATLGGWALNPNLSGFFDTVLTTGYMENDIFGTEAENVKGNFAVHYRPNADTEITLSSVIGTGEAPLPAGNARYNLKDVVVQLHKLELNSGGLNTRFYFTQEDSGQTTQSSALGVAMANAQPGGLLGAGGWGQTYLNNYFGALAGAAGFSPDAAGIFGAWVGAGPGLFDSVIAPYIIGGGTDFNALFGGSTQGAHDFARNAADNRPGVFFQGSQEWSDAIGVAEHTPINQLGFGARIQDLSKAYTFEANYDFEDKIEFAEVIVGGIFRRFDLNTEGTLYTDYDGDGIQYNELGAYAQMKKNLFSDFVTLTASLRYDKVEVLDNANIAPRAGLLFNISDKQNIRVSAQKGFRTPTNQDKFIGLFNGARTLLGTTRQNVERFNQPTQLFNQQVVNITGQDVWNNAFYADTLEDANLEYVESEEITSYEVGYRYNSNNFTLDFNAYYSQYDNYIGTDYVLVPFYTDPSQTRIDALQTGSVTEFGVDANLDTKFNTKGVSLEAIQRLNTSTSMNFIYEYNELDYKSAEDSTFELSWNTPKHRMKFGLTSKINSNVTLSANARYNSEYYYESSFIDAVIPENTVFDAKLMFGIKALDNLQFEVGGNNIAGREYVSIPGSGNIGSLYYAGAKMQF